MIVLLVVGTLYIPTVSAHKFKNLFIALFVISFDVICVLIHVLVLMCTKVFSCLCVILLHVPGTGSYILSVLCVNTF